jgi:hypothetical protein
LDKTALVAADLTTGRELLQALDHSALSISVALWLYSSEYEDWRFVLASRRLDTAEPSEAYALSMTHLLRREYHWNELRRY